MSAASTRHYAANLDAGDAAAVSLLGDIADSLDLRSIERDIVVCALLWLEGDRLPGRTVEKWWGLQERAA